MQTTSEFYKTLLAGEHKKEVKAVIAGVEYMNQHLVQCSTLGGLYQSLSIGNAAAKRINLKIFPQGTIPRQARIELYVRLTDGVRYSEWIPKGVYFFAERETDRRTGVMTILGYDAMLKADQVWLDSSYDEENWPMPVWDAVNDIAARMGVETDPRTTLNTAHPVHYPVDDVGDMTMRNVLRRIAVANGGNWRMTDNGKLLLVPLKPKSYDIDIGNNVAELSPGLESLPITKVEIINENGEIAGQAGSDTGRVLTAESQDGTDAMAADILAAVTGYVYRPYDAVDALIDPAAELGDGVVIGGVYSVLANENITFDGLYSAGISAPGTDEIEDEYPYLSEYQRIKRSVAGSRSLITKTMEEVRLMVEGKVDDTEVSSLVSAALGKVELSVTSKNGSTSFVLTDGEAELSSQTLNLSVDAVNISGTLKASQVNLTGAITFGDLSASVQNDINDSYTMAQYAQIAAANAETLVEGWAYNGGTYIDGRKIMTGTVMASTLLGGSVGLLAYNQTQVGSMDITYTSTGIGVGITSNYGGLKIEASGGNVYAESGHGSFMTLGYDSNYGGAICHLGGGALVLDSPSYGPLSARPTTGTWGQVYFALE